MRAIVFSALFFLTLGVAKSDDESWIRGAIESALPLLNATSIKSAEHRKCYTCHGQGLPILTFIEAKKRGFRIDEENLKRQVDHTVAHLTRGKANYAKGIGQGGKADMAGSALWAIKTAGFERSEVTDAVIEFLILRNADKPHWVAAADRPPSEGSEFTSTFLALQGLKAFEYNEKSEAIERRRAAAGEWLSITEPDTTEDAVYRLRALKLSAAKEQIVSTASETLTKQQRDDGGWGQLPNSPSDAYATASALVALFESRHLNANSKAYRRGLRYLLKTQLPDGSWFVETRSSPIQKYYESGFPHGENQFISTSATALAVIALLNALQESP